MAIKRSLTLVVTKLLAGELVTGYPITYYGASSFVWNSITYASLTTTQLAQLSDNAYNERLAAFKAYVQYNEPGLVIDSTCTVLPILNV